MTFSFKEHTADVRMDVESGSLPALFRQSLLGMFRFLKPVTLPQKVDRAIDVRSSDASALLVDFLNGALSRAQSNKETYTSVTFKTLSDKRLRAKLSGRRVSSFGEDIKAVTYHEAKVGRDSSGTWHAHVIFDI